MRLHTKVSLVLSTVALTASLGAGVAGAAPAEKVTICHGTASATNPYVEVTVSPNSFKDGHFDDGVLPSHGENNNPDFILAAGRTCDQGPGGGVQNG